VWVCSQRPKGPSTWVVHEAAARLPAVDQGAPANGLMSVASFAPSGPSKVDSAMPAGGCGPRCRATDWLFLTSACARSMRRLRPPVTLPGPGALPRRGLSRCCRRRAAWKHGHLASSIR
jgi:hypothetical protein